MKKYLSVFMAACLCLGLIGSACAQSGITIEQLVQANSFDTVFSRHNSVAVYYVDTNSEESYQYHTRDMVYYSQYSYLNIQDREWYVFDTPEGTAVYFMWYIMSDEEKAQEANARTDLSPILSEELTLEMEVVKEVVDNGGGTLTITTEASEEDTLKMLELTGDILPAGLNDAVFQCVYTVDAETLEIRMQREHYAANGKTYLTSMQTYEYDAWIPDDVAAYVKKIDAFCNERSENQSVVTVVYDAGTKAEESFSCRIGDGIGCYFHLRDGYDELYNDRTLNSPYTGDPNGDVTIYAFSLEKSLKAGGEAFDAGDYQDALVWFMIAAKLGDAASFSRIGYLYENGLGPARNYETALNAYQMGMEHGDAASVFAMGRLYEEGLGVRKNVSTALKCYQVAAELNNADALFRLGEMYRDGIGVEQSGEKAAEYFGRAAEQGHPDAMEALEQLNNAGTAAP